MNNPETYELELGVYLSVPELDTNDQNSERDEKIIEDIKKIAQKYDPDADVEVL